MCLRDFPYVKFGTKIGHGVIFRPFLTPDVKSEKKRLVKIVSKSADRLRFQTSDRLSGKTSRAGSPLFARQWYITVYAM